MTAPTNKPIKQEQLDKFKAYYAKNPTWGSLHIVLDDQNVKDSDVLQCLEFAMEKDDVEGVELGRILLQMSKSQRLKLSRQVQ